MQSVCAAKRFSEHIWRCCFNGYGVEYVEDPATHERIPTCHRVQDSPVTSDPDYLQAVELAAGSDRDLYEREAKRIEEIQQGILAISAQEKPYDVFIDPSDSQCRDFEGID